MVFLWKFFRFCGILYICKQFKREVSHLDELFNVEYTIRKVIYFNASNGYAISLIKQIKFDEGHEKTLNDYIIRGVYERIEDGDRFRSVCRWVNDKKYGQQLEAKSSLIVMPSNINGIKRFLEKSIRGTGKKTAKLLVDAYGTKTLDFIKEDIRNLTCIKGIGTSKAIRIRDEVLKHDAIEKLSVYLFSKGVTNYNDIVQIYEKLGDNALDKIQANPYVLCDLISIAKLPLADSIALNSGIEPDSPIRISKMILYYLTQNSFSYGHVFMPYFVLLSQISSFINKALINTDGLSKESIDKALNLLINSGSVIKDSNSDHLYLAALYHTEVNNAKNIRFMLKDKVREIDKPQFDNFFKEFASKTGYIMDETQKQAVQYAYEYRFSILTGGPGTGKTQTINTIIEYLELTDPLANITLAAPTGRAAKRMSELSHHKASTIHRILGISNSELFGNCETDLDTDYVICDESSMIDAYLFNKLLEAVIRSHASLILVGDKDQLPPVGPGMVFKELIESGVVPTTRLETLYRQAKHSQINTNAQKILAGIDYIGNGGLEFDVKKQDFFLFPAKDPEKIHSLILKTFHSLMKIGVPAEDITVLSPMKKSSVGVVSLNELIQNDLNPASPLKSERRNNTYLLRVGDRVMQIKNNYELQVYNGDIGFIEEITEDEVIVSFEDFESIDGRKMVTYENSNLSELELAYAITVHKAQGCEFPCAIYPLNPVLVNSSRSILYTAITRAKSRFIMIGDASSLHNSINKTDNMNRYTNLAERLINAA